MRSIPAPGRAFADGAASDATVVQIPVLRDNYVYLIINGSQAFVVDPPVAEPVLARLSDFPGTKLGRYGQLKTRFEPRA